MCAMENSMLLGEFSPLDTDKLDLIIDKYGDIQVTFAGSEVYKKVKPIRVFPYSLKYKYISLEDSEGEEIGIIEDLEELDEKSREIIRKDLDKRYFVPQIKKVNSIDHKLRTSSWKVETDRGSFSFEIRKRSRIKYIGYNHLLIIDTNGCKYEIDDFSKLDMESRRLIESEL